MQYKGLIVSDDSSHTTDYLRHGLSRFKVDYSGKPVNRTDLPDLNLPNDYRVKYNMKIIVKFVRVCVRKIMDGKLVGEMNLQKNIDP